MKRGKMLSATAFAALLVFLFGTVSNAGFIDDWITQKAETSPGYMEGQKRGYFTGGSFSARWPMNKDYPVSFEPPRLNFGCGGIDAFMGGFSFMNFEYLVQKLQRILQAAPAAAFDLALKNLCEPCSNVIKTMNAMSDALNSLQLDDCKAGKVIAANIVDPFLDADKKLPAAEKNYDMFKGIYELPHKITEIWTSREGKGERTKTEMIEGCPAGVKEIYNTPGTTILSNILSKKGYSDEHIKVIRGLVGDIMVSNFGDGQNAFHPVPPCPESKSTDLYGFEGGKIYVRPISANDYETSCVAITGTNVDLRQWSQNKLVALYNKMDDKSLVLTVEEKAFVDTLPLPIFSAIKVAVASKQGSFILASLSGIVAKAYAFGILKDLYGDISQAIWSAEAQMAKQGQGTKPDCQIDLVDGAVKELRELQGNVFKMMALVQADYANSTKEQLAILDLSRRFEEFNNIATEKLSGGFSPGMARRVMGGK